MSLTVGARNWKLVSRSRRGRTLQFCSRSLADRPAMNWRMSRGSRCWLRASVCAKALTSSFMEAMFGMVRL